jgi:hypothetical protein
LKRDARLKGRAFFFLEYIRWIMSRRSVFQHLRREHGLRRDGRDRNRDQRHYQDKNQGKKENGAFVLSLVSLLRLASSGLR